MSITNLLVISDGHSGCQHAICHIDGHRMDDGGVYKPSPNQRVLWAWQQEMINEWIPWATKGEPYSVVFNGDMIDGVHHGSVTQWSHNLSTQAEAARKVWEPLVSKAQHLYWVRGTEAHVGQSGQDEERLARDLGAVPNSVGQHARYQLRVMVGDALVDCQHHIGISGSMASRFVAPGKEMEQCFLDCARWGYTTPDVFVRSHRHVHTEQRMCGHRGHIIMVVTPGWQLRTPFTYRMLGGRNTTPEFGAVLIRYADGEIFTREFVRTIGPIKAEGL